MGIDVLDGSEAPPAPAAPSCRRHTLARRRLVSILHPGRLCAAGSSRSSTPDALAPQARLDPPPRTRLRRRLVSILHAGGERAWRGLLPSARTAGCVVAFVIAELRAPSRSRTRCRWFHAPRLPVPLARAASSASRVPSACARGAPPGLARPRPRRARVPTPAPRPRQIGSRGRPSNAEPLITGLPADWFPLTGRRMGLEANDVRSV